LRPARLEDTHSKHQDDRCPVITPDDSPSVD
jgi:hypothetical protein